MSSCTKIAIINGPNLNLLGTREPEIYGQDTLDDIIKYTESMLESKNLDLDWYQSNIEGEIVEKIHDVIKGNYKALIINPAAYSHTSVAILDALKMLPIPIVEVHLSNVHAREDFRQTMLTAQAASIIMSGLGKNAYYCAILSQLN
jgi:3-dehydroquinate dehydratase-2